MKKNAHQVSNPWWDSFQGWPPFSRTNSGSPKFRDDLTSREYIWTNHWFSGDMLVFRGKKTDKGSFTVWTSIYRIYSHFTAWVISNARVKEDMPHCCHAGLWPLAIYVPYIDFYVILEEVLQTSNAWNTYHVEIKSTIIFLDRCPVEHMQHLIYIYQFTINNHLNVAKYTIHGSYGMAFGWAS